MALLRAVLQSCNSLAENVLTEDAYVNVGTQFVYNKCISTGSEGLFKAFNMEFEER